MWMIHVVKKGKSQRDPYPIKSRSRKQDLSVEPRLPLTLAARLPGFLDRLFPRSLLGEEECLVISAKRWNRSWRNQPSKQWGMEALAVGLTATAPYSCDGALQERATRCFPL